MTDELDADRAIEAWLAEPGPPFTDRLLGQSIDRALETPQRRRWWPTSRFPKRVGAMHSTGRRGDASEGGSALMLTALSVTAASLILVVGSSLTILGDVLAPPQETAPALAAGASAAPRSEPAAEQRTAVRVTGTGGGRILELGEITRDELRDRVATTMYLSTSDPRVMGEDRFVHHADAHRSDRGDIGPEWGTYRIENDAGAWEGILDGYFYGPETRLSGWLSGEGAYEGLTYYTEYVLDNYTLNVQINGIIFAGDRPTDPPGLEPWDLASAALSD